MVEVIFDLPASLGPDAESKLRDRLGLKEAPQDFGYCLVAVSGDCSAGGMSEKSDCIVLNGAHFGLVKDYLMADMKVSFLYADGFNIEDIIASTALGECNRLGNELRKCGVFAHKWHQRTNWVLEEMQDDGRPAISMNVEFNMIEQGN